MCEAMSFSDATIPYRARTGTDPAPSVVETIAQAQQMTRIRFMRTSESFELRAGLYAFELPRSAAEEQGTQAGQQRKCHGDGPERALRTDIEDPRENERERDLEDPEAEEVEERRRHRIAGAIERLRQHDAVCIKQKSAADDAQTADAVRGDSRVAGERADELRREREEDAADDPQEHRVVKSGSPHRRLGALGFAGPEVLADQRRRRVAQSP